MSQLLQDLEPWLHWLALGSLIGFVLTLAIIPLIVIKLPADYFYYKRRAVVSSKVRAGYGLLKLLKNLLGAIFVLMGCLLLVLPGQGLLTIALGIGLMDFPGKFRLERRLISQSSVLRSINWLRQRHGRPVLELGGEESSG